ncbi:MAG: Asp-tRNA(Asn)/Glu-tRNA(Gln) amidotransferase subunit GatB [Candidatus Uhrbacteria bacterium]|nr:Asp-tRNA(Asn)/Glu-tRNA(Gln) amidotransferase subunit GatB [Patescibacteria group bacterium]MBU1907228.1 Asp-tRNA(Asn)/Glu-tRNA(Gln) amidotransferase subunit GatB [Patescibacteria group bacterium]
MEELEIVIGLEIHVELNTASKMFCACKNDPSCDTPNTNVCPVCMGCVGALPLLNKIALDKTVLLAHTVGSKISKKTRWDRKSYFYPDLPKGYQISQADLPVGVGGDIRFPYDDTMSTVKMNRVHLEEDAAKSIHRDGKTLVDFNRSGVPLVEMVTEPDLRSPEQAKALFKEVHRLVRDLGISSADMEKGQMRCDASISLRKKGESKLYPRVEIKNINSFRAVESALKFQRDKLKTKWIRGEYPSRAITVLWDSNEMATRPMRSKEDAADYRYFPEADIPEVVFSDADIKSITSKKSELRIERLETFIDEGVAIDKILPIMDDSDSFRRFCCIYDDLHDEKARGTALTLWTSGVTMLLKRSRDLPFEDDEFIRLVDKVVSGSVPVSTAKDIIRSCEASGDLDTVVSELKDILSGSTLEGVVGDVLAEHVSIVEEYLGGKEKVIKALVGLVMKETKGAFEGSEVNRVLTEELQKKL